MTLTLENWLQPDVLMILGIFYLVYMWGLPMLCCGSNSRHPTIPKDQLMPYWKAVRQISAMFHLGTVLAVLIMYFMWPHLMGTA